MFISGFAEVISIGAVLPFLGALTAPDIVYSYPIIQPLISGLSLQSPDELALPLTIIFALVTLSAGLFRLLFIWYQTRLGHAVGADLSREIYSRTLYQPYSVHVLRNSSDVISGIINKANGVVNGVLIPLLVAINAVFMILIILFTLLFMQPKLTLILFGVLGMVYVFVTLIVRRKLEQDSISISIESNKVVKVLQEGLGGIRDVLIDGTQSKYCDVYQVADRRMRKATASVQIISNCPRHIIEAFGMIILAVIAYTYVSNANELTTVIPTLSVMVIGAQRLLPVLQQIYSSLAFFKAGQQPLLDVVTLLEQPEPSYLTTQLINDISFKNSIQLNKIKFRYTTKTPWVLKGLNLEITKGTKVGIIGETGSGKSSLIDIIMGLLQPSEGNFLIDGKIVNEENSRSWQRKIAHVPQTIFLTDASIAENIALGVKPEEIDMALVRECAERAQLASTIEHMAMNYEEHVGERGIRLSGGQRQRIGIARALYKQAEVLVFDEATSALDNNTESIVMDAINNLDDDLTIIMVAHRLSTLSLCEVIIELSDGKVGKIGTYKELIA
ncbi:ABC transporter ATP-binding protein [Lentilitoribacter sp. EG35]|uniref:ABC transporter ATP-binding protein n=1 Tax=Lentilitoribacter sp. EG35 TaxID=3234192 RepID=UPI0034611842